MANVFFSKIRKFIAKSKYLNKIYQVISSFEYLIVDLTNCVFYCVKLTKKMYCLKELFHCSTIFYDKFFFIKQGLQIYILKTLNSVR